MFNMLNDVNVGDDCCCRPQQLHFSPEIKANVKEMTLNSTLNQQKLEGKQL